MRRPIGVLLPPVRADRIRRGDLYRVLRMAVLEGVISPGDRLPSTRQAAADYGVSRGLMEEVFQQLADEGLFQRSVGRGTFVAAEIARLERPARIKEQKPRSSSRSSRRGSAIAA